MAKQQDEQNIFSSLFSNQSFFNKDKQNLLRYLFVLVLVGVFFMLVSNLFSPESNNKESNSKTDNNLELAKVNYSVEEKLEKKLESILAQISGVGSVTVNITLETGPEYIYARDKNDAKKKILEEDKSGGTRETDQFETRSEIVVLNQGGTNKAVIKKEIQPQIRGVLVVAEGAHNSHIKADLIAAVKIGLGIESYKIKVLAKER